MTDEKLPKAISESTLTVMGVELKVCVLDNGMRIITADSMVALFEMMESGASMSEEDALKLARFVKGIEEK